MRKINLNATLASIAMVGGVWLGLQAPTTALAADAEVHQAEASVGAAHPVTIDPRTKKMSAATGTTDDPSIQRICFTGKSLSSFGRAGPSLGLK